MLHRCQAVKCIFDLKICKSIYCILDSRRAGSAALRASAPTVQKRCILQRPVVPLKVGARPSYSLRKKSTMATAGEVFFLDDFAIRQWDDPSYSGTRISYSKDGFVQKLHDFHVQVSSQVWPQFLNLPRGSEMSKKPATSSCRWFLAHCTLVRAWRGGLFAKSLAVHM